MPAKIPGRISAEVPGFVVSLWHLVQDPAAQHLISWSEDGKSFVITDGNLLAREVLPCYFKHSNLASFIRQLNLYSFRKQNRADLNSMEFAHPCFLRDAPDLLSSIRRVGQQQQQQQQAGGRVRSDLASVKAKQAGSEEELNRLRAENQQLWLEVQYLRQQQRRQQDAVRWLVNFFSLLLPKRRPPVQMAIEAGQQQQQQQQPQQQQQDQQPAAKRPRLLTFNDFTEATEASQQGGDVTIEEVTEFFMNSPSPPSVGSTTGTSQQQPNAFSQPSQHSQSPTVQADSADIDSIVGGASLNLPSPMHSGPPDSHMQQQLPSLDHLMEVMDQSIGLHDIDWLGMLSDPTEQLQLSFEELVAPPPPPAPPPSAQPVQTAAAAAVFNQASPNSDENDDHANSNRTNKRSNVGICSLPAP